MKFNQPQNSDFKKMLCSIFDKVLRSVDAQKAIEDAAEIGTDILVLFCGGLNVCR